MSPLLTSLFVNCKLWAAMTGRSSESVGVLADSGRVAAVLSPLRRRLLQNLAEPDSASGLARRLGIPRQKINYHLRELERAGLVELAEERQRRGCVERCVRVTARAFVISPEFLEGLAATPEQVGDRFSSAYLVAAAARIVGDVALLRDRAAAVDQRLATFSLETEIGFDSPASFKAFGKELARAVTRVAAKFNQGQRGKRFKLLVAAHPALTKSARAAQTEAAAYRRKKQNENK